MIRYGRDAPNTKSGIRGCIDLGSSYFRLLVAERVEGAGSDGSDRRDIGIRPILEGQVYVGWGAALPRDGLLLPEELDGAVRALDFLLSRSSEAGCAEPMIVGTNTLRRARNREEARGKLEAAARRRVTVLSQRGEAALGFLGASTIVGDDGPVLHIDMGGTSTEIAWGRSGVLEDFIGLPLGTHEAQVVSAGRFPRGAFSTLRERICRGFQGSPESILYRLPGGRTPDTILCTGGTAVSLGIILNYTKGIRPLLREREYLYTHELERTMRRLGERLERGWHRLPLERERTDLLLPGLTLLTLLLRELRIAAFTVTSRDMRWGGIIAGENLSEYSVEGGRDR